MSEFDRNLKSYSVTAWQVDGEPIGINQLTTGIGAIVDDHSILHDALTGKRGEDQAAIAQEVVKWGAMLLRKNKDYGSSVWESPLLAPYCDPAIAVRVRMSDKINRLIALYSRPPEVVDESIDDTIRDLGAYCLLELARPGRKPVREDEKIKN